MDASHLHPSSWLKFVSFGGVASLGISAVLFQISSHQDGKIFALDRVHSLETIASASRLQPMLPLLVAARGRVTSKEPTKCELNGSPAVMRELLEEEVYFKEHTSGRVTQECFELRREQEQREAFLEDKTASVKLENLQHAAGLTGVMEVKQVFHAADLLKGPLLQHVINKAFKSMVKHGCRVTERYLPVDTTVTIVGELVHDRVGPRAASRHQQAKSHDQQHQGHSPEKARAGPPEADEGSLSAVRRSSDAEASSSGRTTATTIAAVVAAAGAEVLGQVVAAAGSAAVQVLPYTLRMPSRGPFYVTPLTLSQLRTSMERTSRTLRVFAWGFGLLGAVLMARKAVQQVWREREARRIKRILAEAETARRQRIAQRAGEAGAAAANGGGGDDAGAGAGADEYDGGRSPGVCVVCLDRDTDVVFSACGHMCTCTSCTAGLQRCPICRVNSRPIRVFRP